MTSLSAEIEGIVEAAWHHWCLNKPASLPASSALVLWQAPARTIYVDDALGPAVPYRAVPRTDSESNFGYVRVKGNLDLVATIPELREWPVLAEFVRCLNAPSSPIESVGCAVGFFESEAAGAARHYVGSYVDVVYTDPVKAQDVRWNLRVAASFMAYLGECERWWGSAEIGLQRLRHLPSTSEPLGLTVRLQGHGRTKDEALGTFRQTVARASAAVAELQAQ